MTIDDIISAINGAITNTASLNALNPDLQLGIPTSFPTVTLDGLICVDDKLGKWTANINLWTQETANLNFIKMADDFYKSLGNIDAMYFDGMMYRPDPQENLQRMLYPTSFWLK